MLQNRGTMFARILIWATVLIFAVLLAHPAGGAARGASAPELLERIYAGRFHLGIIHAAAIVLQLVTATCVLAFCRQLGWGRPLVAFAAVAFTAATGAICVAGSIDGFLVPAFAAPHLAIGDGPPLDMGAAIAAGAVIIQYSTKFGIALMAVSILLLSLQLIAIRALRIVGTMGIVLAIVACVGLATFGPLTPRNVAFSILPVLVWQLVLGIVWRKRDAWTFTKASEA